jgi:hypothetical protein
MPEFHDMPEPMPLDWLKAWSFPFEDEAMPLVAWSSEYQAIAVEIRKLNEDGSTTSEYLVMTSLDWIILGNIVPQAVHHFNHMEG